MPHLCRALACLAVLAAQCGTPVFAQDADKGRALFVANCSGCHSADKAADPAVTLSLFGIVGRKAGTAPGYAYSSAMSASSITWTPAKLDAFLTTPSAVVPGTQMYFDGLPAAADRADLIAYLDRLK